MGRAHAFDASLLMRGAGATDIGRIRKHNEDMVLVREDLQLFAVADGAGGHEAGDVAADLAIRSIANYVEATERVARSGSEFDRFGLPAGARRLSRAVHKANRDVFDIAARYEKTRGMGTTVVALLFSPLSALAHLAHAGDSRCYRLRAGHLELLTQDHSLLMDVLEERPEIEDDVLASLPQHVVTRALGMRRSARVSVRSHEVLPGDRYLLCSDGLSGYVPADAIAACMAEEGPLDTLVLDLVNLANHAGGRDNITALAVDALGSKEAGRRARSPELVAAEQRALDARSELGSGPELLLLGIEEIELGLRPKTVPERTMTDEQRRALDKLLESTRKP
jgi:serine/threonine protein phosphatase PrpC